MRDDCIEAVQDALGRALRKGEAKDIEDNVNQQMRLLARKDPAAWAAKTQSDRLYEASTAAAEAMTAAAELKLRRTQLQIAAHERIENALQTAFDKAGAKLYPGAKMKMVSQLLAFDARGANNIESVDTVAHSIAAQATGRLMPLWSQVKDVLGLFERGEGRRDLIKELYGEDSGNASAKKASKIWSDVTSELRTRGNRAGMNIGALDDWHFPQSHSQSRISRAGGHDSDASKALDTWIADTMPLLDRQKYVNADGSLMKDDQVNDFLRNAFDSIVTEGLNKREAGTNLSGVVANRGSAHRQIFFKDADSYMTYQGKYGDKNLFSVLTGHINKISRDIALVEKLGPNPEQTFRHFNDRTLTDEMRAAPNSATAGFRKNPKSQAKFNESLYNAVAGKNQVVNQRINDIGQSFRNFETATKLGRVAITAIGDEAGMAATAFANKVPWAEMFSRELHYLNPGSARSRAIGQHVGLGFNSIIGGLNRFSGEDLALSKGVGATAATRQITARLANGMLHLSGAEWMWDRRRQAMGSILMSYVGKTVGKVEHFADLNVADHGVLARKGIDEKVWQTWRAAEPEDWGMKHGVLTPDSIRQIPDEKIAHLGNPDDLRRQAATSLLGHILEEVGMGVMDSGVRERTLLQLGTQRGTVGGELLGSALLFKSFAASMMLKHWGRANSLGGYTTAGYYSRLLVIGTILGGVATQLYGLASGKDPANIAEPKFWFEAFLRGGGLGFYGDFLYSELNSHDTSFIPAVVGPLATEAETVYNLTGGAALKAARGEKTDEVANLIRWGKGNIPVINNWYTKAAWDHLVWNNLQEAASPGYLDKMTAKAEMTRNTTYWWDPHESMPQATPNWAKLVQPQRGEQQFESIKQTASNIFPSLE